jgi:hypothetical protein
VRIVSRVERAPAITATLPPDDVVVSHLLDRYIHQIRETVTELGRLPAESLSDEARDRPLSAFRSFPRG